MGVSNREIYNDKVSWEEESAKNTEKEIDVEIPDKMYKLSVENLYEVLIHNSSSNTGLNVNVKVRWEDVDGNSREADLTNWSIEPDSTNATLVQGMLLSDGGKIVIDNDTALEVGEDFSAYIQIREV